MLITLLYSLFEDYSLVYSRIRDYKFVYCCFEFNLESKS